jgi:hypothetical protein
MARSRPGEGDCSRGAVVSSAELPDGYIPPSASMNPDASVADDSQPNP